MRDVTLSDIQRLRAEADSVDIPLEMDEETFCGFYNRTARALRAYLSRVTGDPHVADDLMQETYYRFLRARGDYQNEAHRRNMLFRIATNLARDGHRRAVRMPAVSIADDTAIMDGSRDPAALAEKRTDLRRAMARLRPRDRELLWLAYANGSSHREIATALDLKTASVKLLLFRARRRLATLLRVPSTGAERTRL
jgi:RNA polymerase sigma-70 factor (ECF subfamily)